jgi:Na+-transporting NADH:ubiquinone oxidoreductase subunit C
LENEKMHRNRILCNAFLLDVSGQTSRAYQESVDATITFDSLIIDTRTIPVYFNAKDSSIGFVFSGFGFWDLITGIMVLTPDLSTIKNIRFFEQKETPGLGARIEEKWFTDQFKGLRINWNAPVTERVIIGASSDPDATNRVDAISGASQTSLALMKTINSELELFRKADRSEGQRSDYHL